MDETQLFRLPGKTDIRKIPCDHQPDGQLVIFWDDIEQFFPGVRHVTSGEVFVKMMKDPSGNR
jgi:hypothetical protein